MTANVNIVTAEHPALLVPASCVHKDPEGPFVYVRAPSGDSRLREDGESGLIP
jgi:hypothetical protein